MSNPDEATTGLQDSALPVDPYTTRPPGYVAAEQARRAEAAKKMGQFARRFVLVWEIITDHKAAAYDAEVRELLARRVARYVGEMYSLHPKFNEYQPRLMPGPDIMNLDAQLDRVEDLLRAVGIDAAELSRWAERGHAIDEHYTPPGADELGQLTTVEELEQLKRSHFAKADDQDYGRSEVEARPAVAPVRMTTVTKIVLRTLVHNENRPISTTALANEADMPHASATTVMKRLQEAGWATSTRETREQASQNGIPARRLWQLTDEGYQAAREVVERAQARRASRSEPSVADGFSL